MSANANVAPAVPSSRVEDTSRAVDVDTTSDSQLTDIKIDRGVQSWSVIEYKTGYAETVDARRCGLTF